MGGEHVIQRRQQFFTCHVVTTLEDQIEKLWRLEEVQNKSTQSQTLDLVDQNLVGSSRIHIRDSEGRFILELPKKDDILLGLSFNTAERRLKYLEKRFEKEPARKDLYVEFLRESESFGHMSRYYGKDDQEHYYIPHQPVVIKTALLRNFE